ncbi:AAA family ATPase [Streptomyces sp. Isolate_219]|uniref:AAA family ATPase n=1 Tax=Streptomyces sp. Isolate_219 TaxID=2950110 RepID=UPI0021C8C92E|nr:AAA family ATPase [Streptomyces sp. Isolate_219]MCR8576709.1 AAA family ATPase [Streptomyces sp. Isolate_219]
MSDTKIVINDLLAGINHPAPSATKYRRLEKYLSGLIGLDAARIYTGYVSKAGNMTVRMTQSSRAQQADLLIALIPYPHEYGASVDAARSVVRRTGQPILLVQQDEGSSLVWMPKVVLTGPASAASQALVEELKTAFPDLVAEPVPGAEHPLLNSLTLDQVMVPEASPAPRVIPTLKIDARTRRMLKNAIAAHKAIMLVGPPGTGKSSLVWEVIREVQANPADYEMEMPHELMTVTADESWTVRELIGGDTIDKEGSISFAPGYVLQAIQEDKWLLIDEANRADMDRIFGGLLTWLTGDSMESVTVGRAAPGDPTEIRLGWAESPESISVTEDAGKVDEERLRTTEYKAGQEWRLIGTYNSLDAQRVFRFGLALGRRFAQIPVAPPEPVLFRELFTERTEKLALAEEQLGEVKSRVARIYEIHYASPETAMGPALFLSLPQSVTVGLKSPDAPLAALLAEAYLTCFGPWLARLDDVTLADLGTQLSSPNALGNEWDWVNQQLQHIR